MTVATRIKAIETAKLLSKKLKQDLEKQRQERQQAEEKAKAVQQQHEQIKIKQLRERLEDLNGEIKKYHKDIVTLQKKYNKKVETYSSTRALIQEVSTDVENYNLTRDNAQKRVI